MKKLSYHLGGHLNRTHLDNGALTWAIEKFKISSFLDVGCGPGGMVELAESIGLDVTGIDGDHTIDRYNKNRFIIHDYTTGPMRLDKIYDLVWSCEFVEHVEEQYVSNFLETFKCGKVLILTFSPPNTPGHHHVNCQPESYWIDKLNNIGFEFDKALTIEARNHSSMKRNFVRNNGLVFINKFVEKN